MGELDELRADLRYVREVAGRTAPRPSPRAIYYLWAAIVLLGFLLVDFAPRHVGGYWAVAGPLGGALSMWLGWRDSRRAGHVDRDEGRRHALHWSGMIVAIWLLVPLAATGRLAWDALSPAILVIVALGWYLAGVHLDRPLLWLGVLMAAGYGYVLLVPVYAWTVLGVLVAVALVATALLSGRTRAETA